MLCLLCYLARWQILGYTLPSTCLMLKMLEQFVMQTSSCIAEAHKKGDRRFQQSSTGEVGISVSNLHQGLSTLVG